MKGGFEGGVPLWWKYLSFLVCVLLRAAIAVTVLQLGISYIANLDQVDDLIKDSVAFLILVELDEICFFSLSSFVRSKVESIPALKTDAASPEETFFYTCWSILGAWVKFVVMAAWAVLSVRGHCDSTWDSIPLFVAMPTLVFGCRLCLCCTGEDLTPSVSAAFHSRAATSLGNPEEPSA